MPSNSVFKFKYIKRTDLVKAAVAGIVCYEGWQVAKNSKNGIAGAITGVACGIAGIYTVDIIKDLARALKIQFSEAASKIYESVQDKLELHGVDGETKWKLDFGEDGFWLSLEGPEESVNSFMDNFEREMR